MTRAVAAVVVGWSALVTMSAPAAADAPAPTDYRSEILSIEPPSDAIELRFLGGDNLIEMEVAPGHEVLVIGYRGEPYLLFRDDGSVVENQRSPSTYLNEERYGALELPDQADPEAEPEWDEVASDGVFAWHDHRSHWMSADRPLGAEPGDQILEAVVPLDVDEERVQVTVGSWWVHPPSPGPAIVGLIVGLAASVLAVRRGPHGRIVLSASGSVVALVLGGVAWFSVPAATGPTPSLWLLPLLALASTVVALVVASSADAERAASSRDWLLAIAGAMLVWWMWTRADALVRAILPTDAPWWLDRAVIAGVAPIGASVVAVSLWSRWSAARSAGTVQTA